ncbi:hypothetical protein EJB05_08583 [Eragrostis curvula]|uniref:Uncharacterized protein n=1 Tax=Eragrostis curvula TaxID=38414 RepID=A0A5J9W4F5_9POAL|nr:hypothetical protein EJB05_08583 [Eragrostis curvula]
MVFEEPQVAKMPYRVMLPYIMSSLGLKIRASGVDMSDADLDMITAWKDRELPATDDPQAIDHVLVDSNNVNTREDAFEASDKKEIQYLCDNREVQIHDFNYKAPKKMEEKSVNLMHVGLSKCACLCTCVPSRPTSVRLSFGISNSAASCSVRIKSVS